MKRIKSCIMVILSLAIVMTGIYLFENPAKEVQAGTEYNTDMLSLKFQRGQGSISNKIRVVASVDSPDYSAVGFEIAKGEEEAQIFEIDTKDYPLPRRIESTVYNIDGTDLKMDYSFSPKVVDTSSEYFLTGKWTATEGVKYTVRAWVTTFGGKTIYGQSRCITLADLDNAVEHLNMSFELKDGCTLSKSTEDDTKYADINVTYNGNNTTAKVIDVKEHENGKTVYVNVDVDRKTLPSATKFEFKDSVDKVCGSTIFRNLYTSYSETTEGETTTNTADTSWYDVYLEENPDEDAFVIATNADLYGLSKLTADSSNTMPLTGKTIYLCADIEANQTYPFTPIAKATPFDGVFDGQGHTISGIQVNATGDRAGLFAWTGDNSVIRNLNLSNSSINAAGKIYAGSIVGRAAGIISNVSSNASVVGIGYAYGGIAGAAHSDTNASIIIEDCNFKGTVSGGSMMGGIVGTQTDQKDKVKITDCTMSGSVSSSVGYSGGIYGSTSSDSTWGTLVNVEITGCQVTDAATISATGDNTGGLVGYIADGNLKITSSSFDGNLTSSSGLKGGLVGNVADGTVIIDDSSFTGTMNVPNWSGGFIGRVQGGNVTIQRSNSIGNITASSTRLGGLVGYVTGGNVTIQQSNFAGNLEAYQCAGGLVGQVEGGTVIIGESSFKTAGELTAGWAVGGLVGIVKTTGNVQITNSSFAGKLTGTDIFTGGLVGQVEGGTVSIDNSSFETTGNLTGKAYTGGLIGNKAAGTVTIQNCYSEATFTATGDNAGGLVGAVSGGSISIQKSYFNGNLNGNYYAGGILGAMSSSDTITIQQCYSSGTVNGSGNSIGGILGGISTGGTVQMENCLNTGNVSTTDGGAGGLVGATRHASCTLDMKYCLNRGTIIGPHLIGSVVGWKLSGTVDATSVYATTTSTATAVGVSGKSPYSNVPIGSTNSADYEGVTMIGLNDITVSTEEGVTVDSVKDKLTGFDFSTIWMIGTADESKPELNLNQVK